MAALWNPARGFEESPGFEAEGQPGKGSPGEGRWNAHHEPPLVGESAPMRELRRRVARLSGTRSSVLLEGETGTGKGLVAHALHRMAHEPGAPFVHVDCGALVASMVESELFGHERGAFTGAVERRTGRFEQAGTGTVFLDEVGELSPALQVKLLRVLHDREYERVGGTRTLRMAARVVAATSRDVARELRGGRLRPDLYYRLAVVSIRVPPLRERLGDVPALVRFAVGRLAQELGVREPGVSAAFCAALQRYTWPGNVRELFNLLERLLVEEPHGLPADPFGARPGGTPRENPLPAPGTAPLPDDLPDDPPRAHPHGERDRIVTTLAQTGGNVSRAARRLGLARSTLRYRIVRDGLQHLIPKD